MAVRQLKQVDFGDPYKGMTDMIKLLMSQQPTPYQEYMIGERAKPDYKFLADNGMYQQIWHKDGEWGLSGEAKRVFPASVPRDEQTFALNLVEQTLKNPVLKTKDDAKNYINNSLTDLYGEEAWFGDLNKTVGAYFDASYDQANFLNIINKIDKTAGVMNVIQGDLNYVNQQRSEYLKQRTDIDKITSLDVIKEDPLYEEAVKQAGDGADAGQTLNIWKQLATKDINKKITQMDSDISIVGLDATLDDFTAIQAMLFKQVNSSMTGMGLNAKANLVDMMLSSEDRDELLESALSNLFYTNQDGESVKNPFIDLILPYLSEKEINDYKTLFKWDEQKASSNNMKKGKVIMDKYRPKD